MLETRKDMRVRQCWSVLRLPWRPWQVLGISFWLLVSARCVAANIVHDAISNAWTLTSGAETYRLVDRNGVLSVGYFGPTVQAPKTVGTAQETLRPVLIGEVEGEPLSGDAMQLVDEQTSSPTPGVQVLTLKLRHRRLSIDAVVQYTAWGDTGVLTRVITLKNTGTASVKVTSALPLSLELPKGDYKLRYLYGGWGEEHQLSVERLSEGGRSFSSSTGRSTNGFAPWVSLRNEDNKTEYLAELAWSGNWDMQVLRRPGQEPSVLRDEPVTVRMSMHWDFDGSLNLAGGADFTLPTVAFTASGGDLDDATNQMHSYQRQFVFPASHQNHPPLVQFNSWYPFPGNATVADMKRSADVAAELGVEAFVLDGGWSKQVGDYEPNAAAFPHGLEELSDYVRAKGIKFGLWVEIENISLKSKMFQEHSDWCLAYNEVPVKQSGRCQLNFSDPNVRTWATATIDSLVNRYKVSWIKIDYNIDVGDRFDPHGDDRPGDVLAEHIQHYYAWLDTVRKAHPDLIIENSASGGMRMDTGILAHTDTSWLSDNVKPIESVQLGYGCTIQFASEACNHWMVGDNDLGIVDLSNPPGWWDFMFRVPMNGQFGLSSQILKWNQALKKRAFENIALYKEVRETIAEADVYHLTPPPTHRNPTGWMAIEYMSPTNHDSVLMAYRLGRSATETTFHLRGLDEQAIYEVSQDGEVLMRTLGSKLTNDGLQVQLADEWRAAVFQLKKLK